MLWLETLKGELLFSTTRLVRFDLLSGVVMSAWKLYCKGLVIFLSEQRDKRDAPSADAQ